MKIRIFASKEAMGSAAAVNGAQIIREAIKARGEANIILATGASQFEMISALVKEPNIAWDHVTCFHLDEYVGLSDSHAASFRRYLKERFVDELPQPPRAFHYINGEGDCAQECDQIGNEITRRPIDVAFVGIGENGHLAFNDPPADFETETPYLLVELDEACRQQQFGEGWFPTLEDVPKQAISMSIRQIMKSQVIICTVPDGRKAAAVRDTISGDISPMVPASILQQHERTSLFLDEPSASLLEDEP